MTAELVLTDRRPRGLDILAVVLAGMGSLLLVGVAVHEASWAFWAVAPIAIASGPLVAPSRTTRMICATVMGLLCVALLPAFGLGALWIPAFVVMLVAAARRAQ